MSENRTVRVFVSSPSDVRPERLIAERVVNRLAREFSYHFPIEAVLWEREPLLATHLQDLIVPPHETDIVVTVLWSRLGVPLPEAKYLGAISKVSYTRLLPMGGRVSGCRASSSGERIGEPTITAPPSVSPYCDATFIVMKPPKLWPMTKGRSPSWAAAITARISSARSSEL
jgi:hypothetical protein